MKTKTVRVDEKLWWKMREIWYKHSLTLTTQTNAAIVEYLKLKKFKRS